MKPEYVVIDRKNIQDSHREIFAEMLKKQGKVQGDLSKKVDRCRFICIAMLNGKPASIGAIKQKTASDFSLEKANVPDLNVQFQWELGYLFTENQFRGRRLASEVTHLLIKAHGNENLMASTEVTTNAGMVSILEHNGFRIYGTRWKSAIHTNSLGLFLKFV